MTTVIPFSLGQWVNILGSELKACVIEISINMGGIVFYCEWVADMCVQGGSFYAPQLNSYVDKPTLVVLGVEDDR